MKFNEALKNFGVSQHLHETEIQKIAATLGENEEVYCVAPLNVLVVPRNGRIFDDGRRKPPIYINGLFVITENRLLQVGNSIASQIPIEDIMSSDSFDYMGTRVLQICSPLTAFQVKRHKTVIDNLLYYIDKAKKEQKKTPPLQKGSQVKEASASDGIIEKLKYYSSVIENENLKEALLQIQKVILSIYANKDQNLSNEKSIAKFNSYYIPTLVKLLKNYSDFQSFTASSERAKEICTECEKSVYSIKDAFYRLFDNMFVSSMIDVTGEISALEATLAADGLLEDDMMKMIKKKRDKDV